MGKLVVKYDGFKKQKPVRPAYKKFKTVAEGLLTSTVRNVKRSLVRAVFTYFSIQRAGFTRCDLHFLEDSPPHQVHLGTSSSGPFSCSWKIRYEN